jgi:hypothetical protein
MTASRIYGTRARIGYTSPPLTTEVFAYQFYRIVPAEATLVFTTPAMVERGNAGHALRRTGVTARIDGYGRLCREH